MDNSKILEQVNKQESFDENWVAELVRMAHADNRKPHEKVVDTTEDRAPEFYDGLKKFVSNNPAADCRKGLEYLHRRKYYEAHICFLKAARVGYAEGQYRLGSLYLYGRGVNADYNLAEVWFREAAANGFVPHAIDVIKILERYRNRGGKNNE